MSAPLRGLAQGAAAGALCAGAVLALLSFAPGAGPDGAGFDSPAALWAWIDGNLAGSLVPFALVALAFAVSVERLHGHLVAEAPLETVAQAEYWAELWTSVFFGIGVVWTAIGMRGALLAGLGDLDESVAAEVGAFAILRRLVDGGILLALSTTIVGGIGGYLMRVWKGLRTGALARARQAREVHRSEAAVLERLERLEAHLAVLSGAATGSRTDASLGTESVPGGVPRP